MRDWRLAIVALCLVGAAASHAQDADLGANFSPPPTQEELDQAMADAPWRSGSFSVVPQLGLRNVTAVTSIGFGDRGSGTPRSDFTAGLAAGLSAYYPIGPRFTWTAHAVPEYTWWSKESDRNRVNGRYGMGFFGHLSGLKTELSVQRREEIGRFSREFEDVVSTRLDVARFAFEIPIKGTFTFYGESSVTQRASLETNLPGRPDLGALDRELVRYEGGVRWHTRREWVVGLGYGQVDIGFDRPGDLDRSGTADVVRLTWSQNTEESDLRAQLAWTEFQPDTLAPVTEFTGVTGRIQYRRLMRGTMEFDAAATRSVGFSLRADSAYTETTSAEAGLRVSLSTWGSTRLHTEIGTVDFPQTDGTNGRTDDLLAFGVDLGFRFTELARLSIGVLHTQYDSTNPLFDRDVTITRGGITLGIRREKSSWL